MISRDLVFLIVTAMSLGFFHTVFGPDHYLPFIVISRARKWSLGKTVWLTFLCGLGHIGSSVLLGTVGIIFGLALTHFSWVESFRGNIAAWALIIFGLLYALWGLRQAIRKQPHRHSHSHHEGLTHDHSHAHTDEHVHVHEKEDAVNLTPWILFTIFVLGPCEPLIPLLMYPAAKSSLSGLVLVTTVFGSVTIITMLTIVIIAYSGMRLVPVQRFERYAHVLAGITIALCGLAIQVVVL